MPGALAVLMKVVSGGGGCSGGGVCWNINIYMGLTIIPQKVHYKLLNIRRGAAGAVLQTPF